MFGTGNRAVREMSSLLKRNRKQIEGALIDLGESWDATWEVLPEWHAVWSWLNPVAEAAKPIVENPAGYLYGAHALGVNSIEGMLMPLERLRDMAPGGSPQGGN